MLSMEIMMNLTDYFLTGGAMLTMVGYTNYVDCWFFNTMAIQLLET